MANQMTQGAISRIFGGYETLLSASCSTCARLVVSLYVPAVCLEGHLTHASFLVLRTETPRSIPSCKLWTSSDLVSPFSGARCSWKARCSPSFSPFLWRANLPLLPLKAGSTIDRYRIVISDGVHYMQALLVTQLNNMIQENHLAPHCLIRLDEFICNTVHGRQIALVIQLTVVAPSTGSLVGNPQLVEPPLHTPAAAPAQAPAAGNLT